jgi:DNA topoisomerase-1
MAKSDRSVTAPLTIVRTLVISEKDIAAKKIATHLSGGDAEQSKQGGVNVYEWAEGKGKAKHEWVVVGLRGHIISLDYPKGLQRWSLQKLPELVWAQPEKKVDKDAKPIGDAVKKLAKKADRVIVATDFDREGELIGVEALQLVQEAKDGGEVEIKRARFSALTKEEVTRAFATLADVDYKLAASAEARQVVDLAWGATLTRFLSISAGQRGQDFLSVGRVQSPTLALIVDREKEIRAFQPQPYWEIHATVAKGEPFEVTHEEGRFWEEPKARAVHRKVSASRTGRVTKLEQSRRTLQPPTPFSTTDYQRAAAALGYSIKRADSLAESLYTAGYISYPRTANTVYPASLDLKEILEKLAAPGSPFSAEARKVLASGPLHPTAGKKTDPAHPPIHPVEVAKATDLGGPEWRVYELVVRRFLATLSDPAVVERVKVGVEIAEEPFTANGQRLVQPGFMAVYPYSTSKDVLLPTLAEGDTVDVRGCDLLAKETQPPSRLTQARLVQLMEELGLGTKATRGDIIQKLYDRDFVRNKTPEPTETGFAMIDALERHATLIAKPEMTSRLETEMDKIAEGELPMAEVVDDSRKMLDSVLKDLDAHKDLIGQDIRKALQAKNTIGTCAKSGHPLVMRRSKAGKRFVGCAGWPECDVTFPLPQFGKIVADNSTCPVCGAPVIRVMNNPRRPPWVTCLTVGCKGAEEREDKLRAERRAERESAAAAAAGEKPEDEEAAPATGEADAEDLGVGEGA